MCNTLPWSDSIAFNTIGVHSDIHADVSQGAYRWVQIFATIESNLGVVVASLPALSKGAKIASTMLDSYRSRLLNSHRGRSDATPNSDQDISFGNYHKYERQGSNDDMEMPVLQKNQIVRSTEVYVEQS